MQQAHYGFFVLKRAGFNYRTYKHLGKTASHCIYDCAYDYSCERVWKHFRQKGKSDKSQCRKSLRTDNAFPIADLVGETCAQHIYDKLSNKKYRRDKGNFPQRMKISGISTFTVSTGTGTQRSNLFMYSLRNSAPQHYRNNEVGICRAGFRHSV